MRITDADARHALTSQVLLAERAESPTEIGGARRGLDVDVDGEVGGDGAALEGARMQRVHEFVGDGVEHTVDEGVGGRGGDDDGVAASADGPFEARELGDADEDGTRA